MSLTVGRTRRIQNQNWIFKNFKLFPTRKISVWRCLDGELQDRVAAWCHCVNSPYKGLFTESFQPLPSSAVHTIYLGDQISKAKLNSIEAMD